MKRYIILILLTVCFTFSQSNSEKENIKKAIQYYLDGYHTGNVELLKKAFHPDCVIKYLNLRTKEYSTFTMTQLNNYMKKLPEGWSTEPKINSIDYHKTAAQAKVTIYIEKFKLTWTDYLSLLKIGGKWIIVSKIAHGDLKK